MVNFEERHNFEWLALPCSPIASRVLMLLVCAALLTLPIPAAQATDCVRFADGYRGVSEFRYLKVPVNTRLVGRSIVYTDETAHRRKKIGEESDGRPFPQAAR